MKQPFTELFTKWSATPKQSDLNEDILTPISHINMIIVSIAVALIAWLFAMSEQISESSLMIPVKLRGVDRDRVEVRVTPESLRIRLAYPRNIQSSINSDNLFFDINFDGLFPQLGVEFDHKELTMSDTYLWSNAPGEVRIVSEKSAMPKVVVEARWRAQQADVMANVTGAAALAEQGLVFANKNHINISPATVWITGAQADLDRLQYDPLTQRRQVWTEPISIANNKTTFMKTVGISLPPGLEVVEPKSGTVEVPIDIKPITTEREITGVPIPPNLFSSDNVNAVCDSTNIAVTVRGPEGALKKLDPSSFQILPIRPAEELPDTTREAKLDVLLRSDLSGTYGTKISIIGYTPENVTVHYTRKTE